MTGKTFRKDLAALINRYNMEDASDTPDWILANFLRGCLTAFDTATNNRTGWYSLDSCGDEATTKPMPDRDAAVDATTP